MESGRSAALRLLKFRPRTQAELRERLARKGYRSQEVEAVLAELRQKGLLDDAQFARLFVAQKVFSKPLGRRLLLAKLRDRGIAPALAEAAVTTGTAGEDELTTARRLATHRLERMKGLPQAAIQRRLFGFLSRRGFSDDVVYRVIRELHEQP